MEKESAIWRSARGEECVGMGQIHVWRADLSMAAQAADNLEPLLADGERERAVRYPRQEDRRRFIAARAILRQVLAHYIGNRPENLSFVYGEHGKPALAGDLGHERLEFNMSHSGEMALYAVARSRRVGVDIEYPRPKVNYMRIAERFFSIEEFEELTALPTEAQYAAFYRCWTHKEAYVKARGDGIAAGLGTFSVSLEECSKLLRSDDGPDEIDRWRFLALEPGGQYVAALCVAGQDMELSCFEWSL